MNTKRLSVIILSAIMLVSVLAFASCKEKTDSDYKAGDEVGSYYCVVDGEESTLTIGEDGSTSLVLADENLSGTCVKDEDDAYKLTLNFGDSIDYVAQATYSNNVLSVLFRSNTYIFLKDITFTVTFDSKGGSSVPARQVRHGETVEKPADPQLPGKVFLGWYKDEAFNQPYQFGGEAVTADITLYASYGQAAENEFVVTYNPNYDGASVTTSKTQNGVAQILDAPSRPGSYTFLGWYVSDYEDPTKLTYKYEGQKLNQNTTLFAVWKQSAPVVSVSNDVISWNNLGLGTYSVYVYSPEGELLVSETTTSTRYDFAFSNQPAGEYRVNVSYRGQTGTAYLRNKALAKVSNFQVSNGTALTYNSVENATEYLITIDCGNKGHKHTMLSNGMSTTYNFANCDMQADGINFTVTAQAEGYLPSTSNVFNFYQGLDKVTGLKVDSDTGMVTWGAVKNATSYAVTVTTANGETVEYISETQISLKSYDAGSITVSVQPEANNYYSPEAVSVTYNKSTLACPTNIMLNEKTLVWDNVEGATYRVKIGSKVLTTTTNSLLLDESNFAGMDKWTVQVQLQVGTQSSLYSDEVEISNLAKMTPDLIEYQDGYLTWGNVFGAERFRVTVGTNEPVVLDANTHSIPVTFTRSGEYTIQVAAYGNKIDSTAASIDVSIYTVYYEVNGGTSVATQYVADGDHLTLPESIKGGYNFDGWYNTVGGASSNGKQYEDGIFTLKNDVTMYANWTPKPFNVTLNWEDGGEQLTDTVQVYYNELYTLPVPQTDPNGYAFSGWFLGSVKYTDEHGNAVAKYDRISDVTLTANFVEVLKFEPDATGEGYAVTKGNYISLVTEITIPATYNGKKVTTIDSGAFASCNRLETINVPDTIEYIFVGIEGINQTGSAFQSCTKLSNINIYETGSATGELGPYWSKDGIVYRNNEVTNAVELFAVPYAKSGDIVVADGVQTISASIFKNASKINTVTLPASVQKIEENAFYYNTNLTSIVFEETAEGEEVVPLSIDDEAIYGCSNLLEITFPSRLESITGSIFRSCAKLSAVNFASDDGKFSSIDGVVISTDELGVKTLVYFPVGRGGSYTIPAGVTRIGEIAFTSRFENTTSSVNPYTYYGNTKLTEIIIPGYVTYIGEAAFRGCNAIENLVFQGTINDNPLVIKNEAFYSLSDALFTSVSLPANLQELGVGAFGACSKLVTVTLDSYDCSGFANGAFGTVTNSTTAPTYYVKTLNIGPNASQLEIAGVFGPKLINVNVDPDNANYTVIDDVVYDKAVTNILFYPAEKVGEYVTPETVTSIGSNVFRDRDELTKITIGKNVTSIGNEAFYDCDALVEVVFEEGGTENLILGEAVFMYCNELTTMVLPERVTEVGAQLFYYCYGLESVTLPSTLTVIKYGYDSTLKKEIFNMFYTTSSSALTSVIVAESNPKYGTHNGILYEKDANGNLVTLLFCPSALTGTIDVPKTVTTIGDKAFAYSQAERLTFSQGIEQGATLTFGQQAFYNSLITTIELPEGLTEIADRMFYWSESLVSVTIPQSVTRIGEYAFYYCSALESIVIPNSVTEIGDRAFYYCTSLTSITFEEGNDAKNEDGTYVAPLVIADGTSGSSGYGVSYTGVFSYVPVAELNFPQRTTHIGAYLMGYYSNYGSDNANQTLVRVRIPNTIEYLGKNAFYYCEALESVEFYGEGVSKLADAGTATTDAALYYTFYGCTKLSSINLPESSSPDGYTMYGTLGYSNLTSIVVPGSVKSMSYVFNYSPELTTVSFGANSKLEKMGSSFSGCKKITSITLPDGLKEISSNAFSGMTGLTSMVIPKTVTKIGYNAFSGASNLASITLETYQDGDNAGKSALEIIEYKAFAQTALTEFTFPETISGKLDLGGGTTVVSNKGRLFYNCYALTTVNLSNSVTNIEYVFKDCPNLTTINIPATHPSFKTVAGEPFIYNTDGTGIMFIYGTLPSGTLKIKEGIVEIGSFVFEEQNTITELYIPYTVERIGDGAFSNCANLTKVVFQNDPDKPSALKGNEVGVSMFMGCTNLNEVVLPNSEQFSIIPEDMFNSSGITSIEIPASVIEIDVSAFEYCENLKSVTFPEDSKLKTIGNYAFRGASLETIDIPSTVVTIGNYSFVSNDKLRAVNFVKDATGGTSLTSIGSNAFGYSSLTSTTYTPCTALESIVIPKSVTTINGSAFYNCTALTSIEFEEGSQLTSIKASAFRGTSITSITLPEGIKKIESYLFANCANLQKVDFAGNSAITEIGTNAFQNCTSIESFVVPQTVTKINNYAFTGCTSLAEIYLPEGLKEIGNYAFTNCRSLVSIDIPDTLTKFGTYCFSGCINLESVNFTQGSSLTTLGTYMFSSYKGNTTIDPAEACVKLKTFAVPDGVKALTTHMFDGCTGLETVTFGESSSLNFLGTYTFQNSGLKSIDVPVGVKMIGTSATACSATGSAYTFAGCTNLTTVNFLGVITKIGGYAFYGCTSLTMDIPSTVTVVGTRAFANTGATRYTIPSGLLAKSSNLGMGAFAYNKNLTGFDVAEGNTNFTTDPTTGALINITDPSELEIVCVPGAAKGTNGVVTIPSGVTIRGYAFAGCDLITEIVLPDDMTSIPNQSFADATGLTKVTIPAGVTKIGSSYSSGYVFDGCTNLTTVTFLGEVTLIGGYAFRNCTSLETIEIPATVTDLGYGAFNGSGIKNVTIPQGVKLNGSSSSSSVFSGSKIETVSIDTDIPNYLFYECDSLVNVTIGPNVTKIGTYAFAGCDSLTTINIPANVQEDGTPISLGNYMFKDASMLSNVTLGEGITDLSSYMFQNCTSLQAITLPQSLTYIGTYCFENTGLISITIPSGVTEFKASKTANASYSTTSGIFRYCANLREVILPEGFLTIGTSTFLDCTSLQSIVLPDTVTTIGSQAFSGCTALSSITLSQSLDEIGWEAFSGCTAVEKIVFHKSPQTYFGRDVFEFWTEQQTICFKFSEDETSNWMDNGNVSWDGGCNANIIFDYVEA